MNYSTVSEPQHAISSGGTNNHYNHNNHQMGMEGSESLPALQNYHYGQYGGQPTTVTLDKFDEEEWEASAMGGHGNNSSSLPTEFDLRPELTPTGEEPTNASISFETPVVRSSPSQHQHHHHHQQQFSRANRNNGQDDDVSNDGSSATAATSDSDETLEQVSEIVDQTPSTYQQASSKLGSALFGRSGGTGNNGTNGGGAAKASEIKSKSPTASSSPARMSCGKRMLAMLATSVLSALIIFLMLTCLLVVVLETEASVFDSLRRLPEMVIFSRDYYQPFKEGLIRTLNDFSATDDDTATLRRA